MPSGGCKIKELREVSGASVQVASEMLPNSTERAVTISGNSEAITQCIYNICNIMAEVKNLVCCSFKTAFFVSVLSQRTHHSLQASAVQCATTVTKLSNAVLSVRQLNDNVLLPLLLCVSSTTKHWLPNWWLWSFPTFSLSTSAHDH